jgi:hypothetical protein
MSGRTRRALPFSSASRLAQPSSWHIDIKLGAKTAKAYKIALERLRAAHGPLKAKVTSSNLVGRTNQINDLPKSRQHAPKARLTTKSPTKRPYWRVIGGDFRCSLQLIKQL